MHFLCQAKLPLRPTASRALLVGELVVMPRPDGMGFPARTKASDRGAVLLVAR